MPTTITLHSCRAIEKEYRVNRNTVRGLISGLKIRVYYGPHGSVAIDDAGLAKLLKHLNADERSLSHDCD